MPHLHLTTLIWRPLQNLAGTATIMGVEGTVCRAITAKTLEFLLEDTHHDKAFKFVSSESSESPLIANSSMNAERWQFPRGILQVIDQSMGVSGIITYCICRDLRSLS